MNSTVCVIVNRKAGTATNHREFAGPDDLEKMFHRHGVKAMVTLVEGRGIVSAVKSAIARKPEAIVAAGGDGTISGVASAMAESSTPLGILPLGTMNHFAKDLGMPLELQEAIRTICTFNHRQVDMGEVNGRYFINNASLGAYPWIVNERKSRHLLKSVFGKKAATWVAFGACMRAYPTISLLVTIDGGHPTPVQTPFVFIGNNEYKLAWPDLGGRRSLDNGCLCLYTAHQQSRFGMLRLGFDLLLRGADAADRFSHTSVTKVSVAGHFDKMAVAIDGEVVKLEAPITFSTAPAVLKVIVPKVK